MIISSSCLDRRSRRDSGSRRVTTWALSELKDVLIISQGEITVSFVDQQELDFDLGPNKKLLMVLFYAVVFIFAYKSEASSAIGPTIIISFPLGCIFSKYRRASVVLFIG